MINPISKLKISQNLIFKNVDFSLWDKKYGRQMASLNIAHFFDISLLAWKNVSKKEAKSSYIWRCNNNKKYQWFNLHSYCILHKLLVLLNWKHCIKMIIPTSYLQQSIKILRRKNFWMNPHWRLASINLMKFNCQNIWQSHDSMMYWSGLASGCELMQPKRPFQQDWKKYLTRIRQNKKGSTPQGFF